MKVVMVGSGAVGGYFGAMLQRAGHEVVFVARGETLRSLREHGLTLTHADGQITQLPVVATDTPGAVNSADVVIIAVKTWQVEDVARQFGGFKDAHTRFLTLQNGVEAPHVVGKRVGLERTLGGLVRGFFELEAPGRVRHVGVTPTIIFGQIDGARTSEAEVLLTALTDAGIYSELHANIEVALWEKFLLVTSLSGVGAVTRAPIGDLRAHEATRCMLETVMQEIVMVGKARGVALSDDLIARTFKFVETFPPETTTSMQRDIMNGLPSELDAQTGAVVRLGAEVGVPTPVNSYLYDSLFLQELRARGQL
jgi:2-dehydropantoate 2-reductase